MEKQQVTFSQFASTALAAGYTLETGPRLLRRAMAMVAMKGNGGNQCKAAKQLGMHRNTLGRLLKAEHLPTKREYWRAKKRPPQAAVPLWREREKRA